MLEKGSASVLKLVGLPCNTLSKPMSAFKVMEIAAYDIDGVVGGTRTGE